MNINEIEKEVKKIRNEKDKDQAVSTLCNLYNLKEQTENQLKEVKEKITAFKKNPKKFIKLTEDLW